MLLEVEPLAVDEEAADRAALVVGPVVVHVDVEVVEVPDEDVALDAVERPVVAVDLVLVLGDLGRAGVPLRVAALAAGRRGGDRVAGGVAGGGVAGAEGGTLAVAVGGGGLALLGRGLGATGSPLGDNLACYKK